MQISSERGDLNNVPDRLGLPAGPPEETVTKGGICEFTSAT